jgi:hypothetical protein
MCSIRTDLLKQENEKIDSKINYSLSTFRRCQDSRERGKGD